MNQIKKLVIPVAGKGTRLLPITKITCKTMLPIMDKPVIQYLLEEAEQAGIQEVCIIISEEQSMIREYFDMEHSPYLNGLLGVHPELEELKKLLSKISIQYAFQKEARGLGDAILKAKDFVGQDDFAIFLGDDLILGENQYGIMNLLETYKKNGSYVIGVQEVAENDIHKYGIVEASRYSNTEFKIQNMKEKPQSSTSRYACLGRYILKPSIFAYLESIKPGVGNEIQLTDAIQMAIEDESVYACVFQGKRFDIGSKVGFVEANIYEALQRDFSKEEVSKFLKDVIKNE